MRVQKVAKKARKAGYCFGTDSEIAEKLKALTSALDTAVPDEKQKILNETIFLSTVMSTTDTEKAISDMTDDFIASYPEKAEV